MVRSGLVLSLLLATQAMAQDPVQLCVDQCLVHRGPAGSASHDACIEQMCTASAELGDWAVMSTPDGNGHAARTSMQGRSLSYLCSHDGPGLVAIAGLGGGGTEILFRIDGQPVPGRYVTQNGVHYGAADAGSPVLQGLVEGRTAEVTAGQVTVRFPLAGSGQAIRRAMAACGRAP